MLLASCSSSSWWHQGHCQGCREGWGARSWQQGWQGRSGAISWEEGCQTRSWWGDSSEGRAWPSDRDQGQMQPSDCQPVHGDEVGPRLICAISLWFRVWISKVYGLAQLQCDRRQSQLGVAQAGTGGHGLSWDGSRGQVWWGKASDEAGQGQQGHSCPQCPDGNSLSEGCVLPPTEIWAQMGLAEWFNCCGAF